MQDHFTINRRLITETFSDSPVTRVRIKRNELAFRYSHDTTAERQDEIYDVIIALERGVPRNSPTVRVKILDTDDLNTVQFEIGNTENQTKIIKKKGVDY